MKTVEIDEPMVRRLLAEQFPQWCDLGVTPVLPGGWDNRTFRLGPSMLIRLPSAECYEFQVEKEHRWLPKLGSVLPLMIPVPVAMGLPGSGYPWKWSIYRWIEGEPASLASVGDRDEHARTLGQFLVSLQRVDPTGGPPPGPHNFSRGGSLHIYEREARAAIAMLKNVINSSQAESVLRSALQTKWESTPVWVHGDMSAANLLVSGHSLSAVIDFGCLGVGDPACDLTIAWTFFRVRIVKRSRNPCNSTKPLGRGREDGPYGRPRSRFVQAANLRSAATKPVGVLSMNY